MSSVSEGASPLSCSRRTRDIGKPFDSEMAALFLEGGATTSTQVTSWKERSMMKVSSKSAKVGSRLGFMAKGEGSRSLAAMSMHWVHSFDVSSIRDRSCARGKCKELCNDSDRPEERWGVK